MNVSETTWTEWGVTPQAALDIGNPTHVINADGLIRTEEDARAYQRRLGGIIRRREVTRTVTEWEDVE